MTLTGVILLYNEHFQQLNETAEVGNVQFALAVT